MSTSVYSKVSVFGTYPTFAPLIHFIHPWAGEDLSLKIDERDQTIWICILEL